MFSKNMYHVSRVLFVYYYYSLTPDSFCIKSLWTVSTSYGVALRGQNMATVTSCPYGSKQPARLYGLRKVTLAMMNSGGLYILTRGLRSNFHMEVRLNRRRVADQLVARVTAA